MEVLPADRPPEQRRRPYNPEGLPLVPGAHFGPYEILSALGAGGMGEGGAQVRWSPNGKELFYIAPDDRLMAVPIRFVSNGTAVELGTPLGLFVTSVGSGALNRNRQQYMVGQDGQSFVMNSVVGEASSAPITVILNWNPKRSPAPAR